MSKSCNAHQTTAQEDDCGRFRYWIGSIRLIPYANREFTCMSLLKEKGYGQNPGFAVISRNVIGYSKQVFTIDVVDVSPGQP